MDVWLPAAVIGEPPSFVLLAPDLGVIFASNAGDESSMPLLLFGTVGEGLTSERVSFRPFLRGVDGVAPASFGVNWALLVRKAELKAGVNGLLFFWLQGFSFGMLCPVASDGLCESATQYRMLPSTLVRCSQKPHVCSQDYPSDQTVPTVEKHAMSGYGSAKSYRHYQHRAISG